MCNQCNDSNQEHVHALRTRREVLKAGAALVAAPFLGGVTSIVQAAQAAGTGVPVGRPAHARAGKVRGAATEWLNYAGDKASSKYSPLIQITGDNFNRLRTAWTWRSAEEEVAKANHLKTWVWEATPLMVGGVLYISTLAVLEKYNYGPLFTPPSFQKPTIELPGIAGGASWSGAACDPETGICYVSSVTLPYVAMLTKISVPNTDYYGKMTPVETMQGVPLWKPPYGHITAIDLNTGDHRWMTPAGDLAQSNPVLRQLGLRGLGRAARGHLLLTKTLLIVGQEGGTHREGGSPEEVPDFEIRDPKLSAYDKETGKVVGEVALPRNATGAPMTYMLNGVQFIVVPTGGSNLPAELIALRLP